MGVEKITCRECGLCDVCKEECTLTGRKVTLDSLRNCKKSIKKTIMLQAQGKTER